MHDFIEFSIDELNDSAPTLKALYNKGRSLKELAAMTGFAYSAIRARLEQDGVTFRVNKAVSAKTLLRQHFKSCSPPPFGFCYLEGRLIKDPQEYPVLEIIKAQAKRGVNPSDIARHLNRLKKKTRKGNEWKQPTIRKILIRMKESENYQ